MQIINEGYVAFNVIRLFCTDSVKIYTEYLKILKNIHRSAVTFNTKGYLLFLFKDILQIFVKKYSVHFFERYSYEYR